MTIVIQPHCLCQLDSQSSLIIDATIFSNELQKKKKPILMKNMYEIHMTVLLAFLFYLTHYCLHYLKERALQHNKNSALQVSAKSRQQFQKCQKWI